MFPKNLELFAYIMGLDNDSFPITRDYTETVHELKEEMVKKNSNQLTGVDAVQLKLYQVAIPSGEDLETRAREAIAGLTSLDPAKPLSRLYPSMPPEETVNIIGVLPDEFLKVISGKRKRDPSVDISKQLLTKWNVPLPTIPNLADLEVYLNAPLDTEEKIPISEKDWRKLILANPHICKHKCYPEDLERLFTKTEDESADFIYHSLHEAIICEPPDPLGTEDSFHSFWDRNILEPLLKCLGRPRWIRNSNNTGNLRPDLGLFLNLVCVFRGEENKPSFAGKHPRDELADKSRWDYDPAPYVLGYFAVGADLTIVALQPEVVQGKRRVVIKDIVCADLSTR
ncbi:hypothetical protein BD410DRAFT_840139 [Rickenella mellea]|uniref:Crinkler effector protein N-terminal domain-containing protein n=1 Tax=Rickenella mellea TaxID=50990 RepID=A0A4Y7Q517_9AGAM|nr:hypothetical protein BD410DRAFT_840139 [Rickenella mellea]